MTSSAPAPRAASAAVVNWKEVADAQTANALLDEIDRAMDYSMTAIEPEAVAPATTPTD